jgi:DNA-binding transcriptional ArsR family regulator
MGLDSVFASADPSPYGEVSAEAEPHLGALGDPTRRAILARLERHGGVSYPSGADEGVGVRRVELGRTSDREGLARQSRLSRKLFHRRGFVMTTVLRILRHTDMVSGRPALNAYQERGKARPAFRKAMAHHLKPFVAGAA